MQQILSKPSFLSQNGQIMAICLGETEAEARRIHEQMESVAETRHGAELLANKEDGALLSRGSFQQT